jgi:DNA (cytosine-5)-methyltransferase 1
MKYFSAFSGIGGFELAMPDGWECVGYSEIEKRAIKVYQKHFPIEKAF